MGNVLNDALETYSMNLKLVVLFSIPFLIAVLIPFFAPLPTFISAGGLFIRTASIFSRNLNPTIVAIIIAVFFFSLLFISFAFVAINLIVKSRRTHLNVSKRALLDIERYMGKVFAILLVYTIILIAVNVLTYDYTLNIAFSATITALVGLFGFILIFYAPSAIVIDEKGALRAVKDSVMLVANRPQYFVIWLLVLSFITSLLDLITITALGTLWSRYAMLVISSLFVLPYFVIFQAEAYMKRFPILRH